jgi:hypothetical protein
LNFYLPSDEDDLNKPLPSIPTTNASGSSSSSSSDSFYSEPLYGITNQITNRTSNLKNPGPPVPDTLRRPSLSPNPHANISCNNVRTQPVNHAPIYQVSKKHKSQKTGSSIYGSSLYGYSGSASNNGIPDYADSTSLNPNASCRIPLGGGVDSSSNFPNDKLPPIPPSKFSSIAKTAGKKLAKKFLGIRKTSKSSLENYDVPSSSASSTNGSLSGCPNASSRLSNNPSLKNGGGGSRTSTPVGGSSKGVAPQAPSQNQIKKSISRPSIPPPEPPKSLYGGSSNGSAKNCNVSDKSSPVQQDRDDPRDEDDDFDDSDFYDSDSELIRNFVSQVQPIYSMEEEPLYQYYAYGISSKVNAAPEL